jgi:drug/metabolite transporter (DMT)-like permease
MPGELEGLPSHYLDVVGFGIITLIASFLTYALCWYFLDYSGKGPTQGETRTIIAAYALSIIGACSTMLQGLIVHLLAAELSVLEALFWSSLVRFTLALPFVLFDLSKYAARAADESAPLLPKQSQADVATPQIHRYAMLALRGFMGTFGGHLALYWGVQFLFPSEAAALWSTAPFFALLFGYIILKEVLSTVTVTMICLGFVGVLLVIQPVELVSWLWTGGFNLVRAPRACTSFRLHDPLPLLRRI